MKLRTLTPLFVLLSAMLAMGCNSGTKGNGNNELSVYLSDAPADYESLKLAILSVEASKDGKGGWTPLTTQQSEVDLLTLVNGKMLKIASGVVPDGEYTALRFTFDPAKAKIGVAGESYNLQIATPSCIVELPTPVAMTDAAQTLMIDIDVSRSVTEGFDNLYVFSPQMSVIDPATIGSVQGGVVLKGGKALDKQILITFRGADIDGHPGPIYSTYSELKGPFFMRLAPGKYTMDLVLPTSMQLTEPWNREIEITLGRVLDLGLIEIEIVKEE